MLPLCLASSLSLCIFSYCWSNFNLKSKTSSVETSVSSLINNYKQHCCHQSQGPERSHRGSCLWLVLLWSNLLISTFQHLLNIWFCFWCHRLCHEVGKKETLKGMDKYTESVFWMDGWKERYRYVLHMFFFFFFFLMRTWPSSCFVTLSYLYIFVSVRQKGSHLTPTRNIKK